MDKNIPMLDGSNPDIEKQLAYELDHMNGSSDYANDRKRPYNGQPWTANGKRGKTQVVGLTLRDLQDCFVQGALKASGDSDLARKTSELHAEDHGYIKNDWVLNDLYAIDWSQVDPLAVWQMTACFIEKYMGIFPNIPARAQDTGREP